VSGIQLAALGAIALVTLVNCTTVAVSGRIALGLTIFKIILVVGIGVVAMALAEGSWTNFAMPGGGGTCEDVAPAARGGVAGFGAAMLGALWAYNGWNEVTYVAEEVKNPQKALPLALIGGIGVIATLYIFVNATYYYVLTPVEVASVPASSAVATEVVARALGPSAAIGMAGVLAMSIFGALLIASLVSARIPYAMARDGMFFAPLAHLGRRTRVPIRALIAQAVWSSVLVLSGSYDTLTDYAIFTILIFVALAGCAVYVFRRRMPHAERAYRVWGYPVVPALFLLMAGWLVVNTLITTPGRALAGLGLMALGLPFYWYWDRQRRSGELTGDQEIKRN
jgi:APA family basic amino acid/polyamine antiporter